MLKGIVRATDSGQSRRWFVSLAQPRSEVETHHDRRDVEWLLVDNERSKYGWTQDLTVAWGKVQ